MELIAEVVRSGLVESRHRGTVVRVFGDGAMVWAHGDPDVVVFPRSANKPIQALAMLRAGLPLDGPLLAIAMSSHSGEDLHLRAVREILALAGLDESALQAPPSYPLDPHRRDEVLRAGAAPAPIFMDCSGKHAAMLLTCVRNGWPTESYLEPEHPMQQVVAETFAELTGSAPAAVGVDGCGAPLLGTRLVDLARAIGDIRRSGDVDRSRLVEAWLAHPDHVSGSRREERALMGAVPGLAAKSGAESVYVAALADGTTIALKVEDGGERALYVAMNRALELAGVEASLLSERPVVLGGGRSVGEVRPAF